MPDVTLSDRLGPVFEGGQPADAIHGAWYNPEGKYDGNHVLKRAGESGNWAREKLTALHDLRVNPNPEEEAAVHARKLSRLIDGTAREWAGKWDDVRAGLKAERRRVEDSLRNAANLKPDAQLLNATLGTFQTMKPEERTKAIDELIADPSGGPVLAILIEKPGVLTGLSPEERERIKVQAYSKADPNGYALLQQLEKSASKAEATSLAFLDGIMKLAKGTDRFDKKVEQAKALEQKVRSGFAA